MFRYIPMRILCFFYRLYAFRVRVYKQKLERYAAVPLSEYESSERFVEKMIQDQLETCCKMREILRDAVLQHYASCGR